MMFFRMAGSLPVSLTMHMRKREAQVTSCLYCTLLDVFHHHESSSNKDYGENYDAFT